MDGEIQITIPAHRTFTLPVGEASVLYILDASDSFAVKPKVGSKIPMQRGSKLGGEGGKPFQTLIFYNTTAAPITATIYVSTRNYSTSETQVISSTATAISTTSSAPASAVYVLTANNTVEQIAPGSPIYVTSIEFFPGKAVSSGVITPNSAGEVYVGRTATLLPYKRSVEDTDYPVTFVAPPGQKLALASFYVRGQAGDGVAYTYTPA